VILVCVCWLGVVGKGVLLHHALVAVERKICNPLAGNVKTVGVGVALHNLAVSVFAHWCRVGVME